MELEFQRLRTDVVGFRYLGNGCVVFQATKPTIIQPSEIMKISAAVILDIPENFILSISTHSFLYEKAAQIFPSVFVLDMNSPKKEIFIPVLNQGRNQLNIMPENPLAVGYLTEVPNLTVSQTQLLASQDKNSQPSRPQKKNADIQFEIKN